MNDEQTDELVDEATSARAARRRRVTDAMRRAYRPLAEELQGEAESTTCETSNEDEEDAR